MIKKVIKNLDSSKASGPDCIPLVLLTSCEPELSYILAEPVKMCLKVNCFPDCWKDLLVVSILRYLGEWCAARDYRPVGLLSVVSCGLCPKWGVRLADVPCFLRFILLVSLVTLYLWFRF